MFGSEPPRRAAGSAGFPVRHGPPGPVSESPGGASAGFPVHHLASARSERPRDAPRIRPSARGRRVARGGCARSPPGIGGAGPGAAGVPLRTHLTWDRVWYTSHILGQASLRPRACTMGRNRLRGVDTAMSGLTGGYGVGEGAAAGPGNSPQETPPRGLTIAARARSIMSAEPPSRRAAEPPSRRAAEPPSRRAAEPPSRRAAEPPSRRAAGDESVRRMARVPSPSVLPA